MSYVREAELRLWGSVKQERALGEATPLSNDVEVVLDELDRLRGLLIEIEYRTDKFREGIE